MTFNLATTHGAWSGSAGDNVWQAYRGELEGEIQGTDISFEGNESVETEPLDEDRRELYGPVFEHYNKKAGSSPYEAPFMYQRREDKNEFLFLVRGSGPHGRVESITAYFSSDRDDSFEHAKEVRDEVLTHWKRGDEWAYKSEDVKESNLLTTQEIPPVDNPPDMEDQIWTIPESEYENALRILRRKITEGTLDSAAVVDKSYRNRNNGILDFEGYDTVIYIDENQSEPSSTPLSETIDNIRQQQRKEQQRHVEEDNTALDRIRELLS